jgi:CheY-like chemotaxis protein
VTATTPAAQAGPGAGTPTERVRILLVDDRSENLVALEAILGSLEHELIRARSGEDALKALLLHDFAVILLDASMPGMDGFETATRIKRREKTRDIPIIFLTALNNEPQHAFRGYEVGAVDYLTKPFDPWILRAKVSVFVELYLTNRQLREQAALLRRRLGATEAWSGLSTADVVADLSARLEAVQQQVGAVAEVAAVSPDAKMATELAELSRRTALLRDAIDTLAASAGT